MSPDVEIRKDYFLDRYSIIAHKRKFRPKEFGASPVKLEPKKCFFCPGNEEDELRLAQIPEEGAWGVRWLKNKYPALAPDAKGETRNTELFKSVPGFGYHEVIIETPNHGENLYEQSVKQLLGLFWVYKNRYEELIKRKGIKYVVLFKNHGPDGGASIIHEHSQAIAQGFVPTIVKQKIEAMRGRKCGYCSALRTESKSPRSIFADENFVSFAPFAPRFSHEVWLMPRRHCLSFLDLNEKELISLAKMIKKILSKVEKISQSYNITFYYSPTKQDNLHFHIEVCPRTSIWAGYELGSSDYIISVPPEESARFYRGR